MTVEESTVPEWTVQESTDPDFSVKELTVPVLTFIDPHWTGAAVYSATSILTIKDLGEGNLFAGGSITTSEEAKVLLEVSGS